MRNAELESWREGMPGCGRIKEVKAWMPDFVGNSRSDVFLQSHFLNVAEDRNREGASGSETSRVLPLLNGRWTSYLFLNPFCGAIIGLEPEFIREIDVTWRDIRSHESWIPLAVLSPSMSKPLSKLDPLASSSLNKNHSGFPNTERLTDPALSPLLHLRIVSSDLNIIFKFQVLCLEGE
jgi:hypothetical protein